MAPGTTSSRNTICRFNSAVSSAGTLPSATSAQSAAPPGSTPDQASRSSPASTIRLPVETSIDLRVNSRILSGGGFNACLSTRGSNNQPVNAASM